jgi:hypothetical protein
MRGGCGHKGLGQRARREDRAAAPGLHRPCRAAAGVAVGDEVDVPDDLSRALRAVVLG